LWWQAGCWVCLNIKTASEPLTISGFRLSETGFPLTNESTIETGDPTLQAIVPLCFRTLQACAHETYMDCPFYEQLQYIGDTRVQILLSYVTGRDDRLAQKAIDIFRTSNIGSSPFPASNYPSRKVQVIPPFALWWVCMVYDHALWRGNAPFVRKQLPFAWWIVETFLVDRAENGLVRSQRGWNYVDSCGFDAGEPPGSHPGGISPIINWQLVLALDALAAVEEWCGMPEKAALAKRLADEISGTCINACWDETTQMVADDLSHHEYSQHSQALAILSRRLTAPQQSAAVAALKGSWPRKAGPYFMHYVCDALHSVGESKAMLDQLREWKAYLDHGFKSTPEGDINGRSDCHAWSAHPQYHLLVHALGIRPGAMGFTHVLIEPRLGDLSRISGSIPHPQGLISTTVERHNGRIVATADLPKCVTGELIANGVRQSLQ
ncbi:MAG: alpha-L-rhamnosidase, partial [Planctomycetes bacterium]|nr:alpha-L-rhamnosidase [Planctomycetota bacterium]